jgi:hypothetical protein
MAPKAAQKAAMKKAAKQRKILALLALPLLGAFVFAYMTLTGNKSAPAVSATPAAATTPGGEIPTGAPAVAVTPGIVLAPVGSLHSFAALGRKDPFHDGGPSSGTKSSTSSTSSSTSTSSPPRNSGTIYDQTAKTASSATPSPDAGLKSVVLKASQVGAGYQLKVLPDSLSLCVQGCVTLDICGFGFTSEADRTARLQVGYVKTRKDLLLSNEVVRYRSGGAALAMHELARAAATCPHHPVISPIAGVDTETYHRIHRFTAPGLVKGAIALSMQVSATAKGRHVSVKAVAIYQVRGNILSGVYVSVPARSSVAPALAFAVHAAQASATNLMKAGH